MRMNICKTGTAFLTMIFTVISFASGEPSGEFDKALSEIRKRIESGAYKNAGSDRIAENFAMAAFGVWANAGTDAEKAEASGILEEAFGALAGAGKISEKARLTFLLQAAGAHGLKGNFAAMENAINDLLRKSADVDMVSRLEAFQDAALFYMPSRNYDVVRVIKKHGDALLESARIRNTYDCAFNPSAPIGVGGWLQSDFIKDQKNRESRFRPYPSGQDAALIEDVLAVRPVSESDATALENRGVAFYMMYDILGWHIYVRTDEPDIEKVMVDGGRGSSLEMFFAPGLERVPYYQWILGLATGKVDLYHWDTPHRFYRYLKHEPGNFQVETVALENGWGTAIFIPWECLYDKLPFMAGNDDTWRFSIMRWGPTRLTWGGRVHETGRWGLINWQAPNAGQRTAILRRLVRRAWRRYNSAKGGIVDFWNCPRRGDPEFFEAHVKPLIEKHDGYAERMETVDKWDEKTVEDMFENLVPAWMEFDYEVETLREQYLVEKMFL